jgi:NAD(P)-dependent dehydrogenase (short-subunit alcohol dehydrogenase family)
MSRFSGEVAIVTGGASGIGAATCRRLAADGAVVVVADLDGDGAEAVAQEIGGAASAVAFDAGDPSTVERLVETTVDRHGRLDILHNNAALLGAAAMADGPVADLDLDLWDRVMAINVRGYVAGCKYALAHMCAAGKGAIVNTTSVQGLAGDVTLTGYAASKAAIISLTRAVATQYGAHGVRCNAVAPGLIVTPAVAALPPEFLDSVRPHVLLDRMGAPEDIANLVSFLASDEAGFITGEVYACDGGLRAHLPNAIGGAPAPARAATPV